MPDPASLPVPSRPTAPGTPANPGGPGASASLEDPGASATSGTTAGAGPGPAGIAPTGARAARSPRPGGDHTVAGADRRVAPAPGGAGAEVRVVGLSAAYGGRVAVDAVDLRVPAGQVVAVVGPNGCGKSTLLRTVARLHRPAAGSVLVGGDDVWRSRPRSAARRVALLPQDPRAPEAITVAGLVRYGRHPHQGLFRQWSRADEDAVRAALRATGTEELAARRLDQLSGGQRQRCWLAMVLAQQTPVILLDEPTSALDLGHAVDVLSLVREVAAAGRTVVMVLHDLGAAARHADTLVAMKAGRVVASGPAREVVDAALVRELYGIDADILAAPGDGAPVVVPAVRRPA